MSPPKKYEYVSDGYTARFINPQNGHAAPYGEYVRWEDYARIKAEVEFRVTSEGEKPDQSDKDFKITIGFNSLEEFERDVVSARQLIPQIIAMSKQGEQSK